MNLYGVALASDTLASRKAVDGFITTEGNNKIWTITGHQVQALHYGNTLLGGIPHKIQFEAWVRTLTKPLPNIQAYVTSYKNYCEGPKSIHSRKTEAHDLKHVFKDALNRLNNIVELLQRTGLIQIPVKIEPRDQHASIAHEIGVVAVQAEYSFTAKDGTELQIAKFTDGQFGPVSFARGRSGGDYRQNQRAHDRDSVVDGIIRRSDGRIVTLPSGESGTSF
jgi:hypothetical protein